MDTYNNKLKNPLPTPPCNRLNGEPIHTKLQDMHLELANYCKTNKRRFRKNPEIQQINDIQRQFPLVIFRPADKNLGTVALDIEHYDQLVMAHLLDETTYRPISSDPESKNKLLTLVEEKYQQLLVEYPFYSRERKFLGKQGNFQLPHFYANPKIHKNGELKGRPIAGAINWYTTPISIILATRLKKYMTDSAYEHILNDSYSLVKSIENENPIPHTRLVTADVEALYPNIPLGKLFDVIRTYMIECLPLTIFVCTQAYLEYNNKIYKQIKGIAMGTNAAVYLANIYMAHTIDSLVLQYRSNLVLGYRRYIDDLFLVIKENPEAFAKLKEQLNAQGLSIIFSEPQSRSIDFLDLTIYYKEDKSLGTRIYQKTLSKYQYLTPNSCHPQHTFSGFIIGELTRYARLSTDNFTYQITKEIFRRRLLNRRYNSRFINGIFRRHLWTQRYKQKEKNTRMLPLVIRYSLRANQRHLHYLVRKHAKVIKEVLPLKQPQIVYSGNRNICHFLCKTRLTKEQSNHLEQLALAKQATNPALANPPPPPPAPPKPRDSWGSLKRPGSPSMAPKRRRTRRK